MNKRKGKFIEQFNRQGMTLPELLIAAAILGIAITGMLISYLKCMELNLISTHMSVATKAASSRMEQIKATGFDQVKTDFDAVAFDVGGINAKGVTYVDDTVSDFLTITVAVSWKLPNGRLFGEDANLNGQWDSGEDTISANSRLDGAVQLINYIFDE